jgi:hypothetical protein
VLGFVVMGLTVLDWMALNDVYHDYVSREVFAALDMPVPRGLPDWSATPMEWMLVRVRWFATFGFLMLNAVTLALCVNRLKPSTSQA